MARVTIQDKVDAIPEEIRQEPIQSAVDGQSIISLSRKFKLRYRVVQHCLWQYETPVWRGTKQRITHRLNQLKNKKGKANHNQQVLIDELEWQINYLYSSARQMQKKLDKVKSVVNHR